MKRKAYHHSNTLGQGNLKLENFVVIIRSVATWKEGKLNRKNKKWIKINIEN